MSSRAGGHHGVEQVPTEKKLEDLYRLIDGIEVCMFTTRRPDGHLVSRPMQTQDRSDGADLWFVTNIESNKLDELATDPHVNLASYRDRTKEWVSVITARSPRTARRSRALLPEWRARLATRARTGWRPDDPRIALVLVDAHSRPT